MLLCYDVDMKGGKPLLKELNQVIDYIEAHLTDDLSLERISEEEIGDRHHFPPLIDK